VHNTKVLGTADRLIGGALGLLRGLIVLGLFNLLFHAVTPPEQSPVWITHAKLYPLSQLAAKGLRVLAPRGLAIAHQLSPTLANEVKSGDDEASQPSDSGQSQESRYKHHARKAIEDAVDNPR
jgi:membrane protein required for colicin V production